MEKALARFWFQYPIVLGYLNMDLDEDKNSRIQLVADLMTKFGFIDLMQHLWQRHHFCHMKTWTQVH